MLAYEWAIKNRILEIFLNIPDEHVYEKLLRLFLKVFESQYGTFGYFDTQGNFVVPFMTREIYWEQCQVPDKEIIFQKGTFKGIWARALEERKVLYSNDGPFKTPEGHIPITNTIVAPIIYRDEIISTIHLANKRTDYTEEDRRLIEIVADQVAPVLNARLERDRHEAVRRKAEQELKAYARTQEALVHELNHRVRNNLTAILGMLQMEADRCQGKEAPSSFHFLRTIKGRIEGLLAVHNLLGSSGWQSLDLKMLCEEVVNAALRSCPVNKKVEVEVLSPGIEVTSRTANYLALVLNELAANSIKHALKGEDTCRIAINIEREGSRVTICYRDNGPGFPEEISREARTAGAGDALASGSGLWLIRGIVTHSLGGDVRLSTAEGAVVTIDIRNSA